MRESEKRVDEKHQADGWVPFSNGWPDRAYVRVRDGKLEVKLVEIKGPTDSLKPGQELMHTILRSQGLDVQIEPASKAPKAPIIPLTTLILMLKSLESKRQAEETLAEQPGMHPTSSTLGASD